MTDADRKLCIRLFAEGFGWEDAAARLCKIIGIRDRDGRRLKFERVHAFWKSYHSREKAA